MQNPKHEIAKLMSSTCCWCKTFGKRWTERKNAWPCPQLDHLQNLSYHEKQLPDELCSHFIERPDAFRAKLNPED